MSTCRSRFKFSLISLLVTVNVAGMLLWANLPKDHYGPKNVRYADGTITVGEGGEVTDTTSGWPWTYQAHIERHPEWPYKRWVGNTYYFGPIIANFIIAAILISLSLNVPELLVRKLRGPGDPERGQPQEPVDA